MKIKKLANKVATWLVNRGAKKLTLRYFLADYPTPYLVELNAYSSLGLWAAEKHWFPQLEEVFDIAGLREFNIGLVPDIIGDFPVLKFQGFGITVYAQGTSSGYLGDDIIDVVPISEYPEEN